MTRLNESTDEQLTHPTRPTRRRLLVLGRVALVSGVPGLWHSPAKAGRKKKCRRPCNSEQRCVRGKCEWIQRP